MSSEEKARKIDTTTKPFRDELHQEMISSQSSVEAHQYIVGKMLYTKHLWQPHNTSPQSTKLKSFVKQPKSKTAQSKEYKSIVQLHYQIRHDLASQATTEQPSTTNADELSNHRDTTDTHIQQDIAKHYQDVQKLDRKR